MHYKSAKGYTGWAQLGILIGFVSIGLILTGIIQLIIGKSLISPGTPVQEMGNEMMKALFKPENVGYLQLSQIAGTIFLMFLPSVIYSLVCNGKNKLWLGFSKYINIKQVLLGFLIIFCANIIASPAADLSKEIISHFPSLDKWAQGLENDYNNQVMAMSNLKSWGQLVTAIVIMAFFPALFEEIFFRGAIQNLFLRWWKNPWLSIIVTALVFSFIHNSVYLFISRAILGFALGLMYYQSKNLWVNIIAHFLNNCVAVIQLFAITRSSEKIDISKLNDHFPIWIELLCLLVFYLLFFLFKRVSVSNREKIEVDEQKLWTKPPSNYKMQQTNNSFN
jgi:membrane protease YdiL (CAAX protease family)